MSLIPNSVVYERNSIEIQMFFHKFVFRFDMRHMSAIHFNIAQNIARNFIKQNTSSFFGEIQK